VLGGYREIVYAASPWEAIAENTKLFVAFGGVALKNGQISQGGGGRHIQRSGVQAAAAAGVQFVNISPIRTDVLEEALTEWLAPRPSTDVAVMLGLAHTLLSEDLHDQAFLDGYTTGFDTFRAYLLGESDGVPKTAEWAAGISEIPADSLCRLARRLASQRTMISVSWSLTRQDHGEQPFWAAIALASMIGQIGLPGGGIGFGYSAVNTVGLDFNMLKAASLPQFDNPVDRFIPVARISDMLLNPGKPFEYNGTRYTYPDIKAVYWAGGNPFHYHQDLNRMLQAWRQPDTIFVHDWCWNAAARHADIVLPCTTHLERSDLAITPRDRFLVAMEQASAPAGEARDDYDILRGVARHMGVEAKFSEGRTAEEWQRWIYDVSRQKVSSDGIEMPSLDKLRQKGWHEVPPPAKPNVMLEAFRADPTANPLRTPSGRIEIFSETVASFGYADCPGHPAWLEPLEWLSQADTRYPLHLISNQPSTKLHSQLDHGGHSRKSKIHGREPVTLHPDDAAARNISDGDIVRLFNDRGACLSAAIISNAIRPGVMQLPTGAWFDPLEPGQPGSLCKHGNPNMLTPDKGTSNLAQGPIAHTCMVEIERYDGELPTVTAFDPPEILQQR
jgi:biotin/methionine sulfoxide reductase